MTRYGDAYAYLELPVKGRGALDVLLEYEPAWTPDDVDTSALRETRTSIADRGIDQKDFLLNASAAEVEQRVAEVLEVMKPGGGYMLSTVDYLSEDTPLENVQALVDAGRKYGRY